MANKDFKYIIVGAGLAGTSAIEGIRSLDQNGSILLAGQERHLPYNRPPLSKNLWLKKKKVEDIFVHDRQFYVDNKIDVLLNTTVARLDVKTKTIFCDSNSYHYEKLLLVTGGTPRHLNIPGGHLDGIYYYRYLDDYLAIRPLIVDGTKVTVIGSGFIGSEMAAALNVNKADVTMITPESRLVQRIFPKELGEALANKFIQRGVKILSEDKPASFTKKDGGFVTHTANGKDVFSQIVIVGIGIEPETVLAKSGNLAVENGVTVNEYLQTSQADIYAAGDNAFFPYQALGERTRIEHWDNALNQGKTAGLNMAGANKSYDYMPYFFSDLFEFGYEAVGQIDSRLDTFADWQKEYETGVVYYLKDSKIRGVMMCNLWDKVDTARELIKQGRLIKKEDLRGVIK